MDQGISATPKRTSTSRGTCQVYHVASFLSLKQWYSCTPERGPVNAFSTEFWKAYGNLFDSLTKDGYDVRAVVLSSAFPKIFTAGLDREWLYSLSPGHFYPDYHTVSEASVLGSNSADSSRDNARASLQTRKTLLAFQHAVGAPERAPFPVIAAVHGHVIGLGVDLISACDIRYAASNSIFSVKVGAPVFPCYFHAPKFLDFLLLPLDSAGSWYWFSPWYRFSFVSPKNYRQSISCPRTHLYCSAIFGQWSRETGSGVQSCSRRPWRGSEVGFGTSKAHSDKESDCCIKFKTFVNTFSGS